MWIDVPPFLPFFLGGRAGCLAPRGMGPERPPPGDPDSGRAEPHRGMQPGPTWRSEVFHYTLTPFGVGTFSLLFGYLFHIAAFIWESSSPFT